MGKNTKNNNKVKKQSLWSVTRKCRQADPSKMCGEVPELQLRLIKVAGDTKTVLLPAGIVNQTRLAA